MGSLLIDWTARATVVCVTLRLAIVRPRRGQPPTFNEVLVWTLGWVLLVLHVGCAFHFLHHWSHLAAWEHTARRTAEVVGWSWGGGVYFNYATLAIWGVDIAALAAACRSGRPAPRRWSLFAAGWVGFMVVNATVVFGPRWWWWAAAALIAARAAKTRL